MLTVISLCIITDTYAGDTLEQLKTGIQAAAETAAGEALPPGVSDLVNGLRAAPDVTKRSLSSWLDTKIQAAALDGDFDKIERYQAFKTCIDTGNCTKLKQLQNRPPAPDKESPLVLIKNPSGSGTYSTGTSSLNIDGSSSDNVAVTKVTWTNDKGGSGTCTGTDNWSASGIALQSGDNVITVTASDAAGNSGTDTITVTYTPPDKTAPTVSITNPTSSGTYSTGTSSLNIDGSSSDNVAVTKVTWSNDKGGNGTCTGTDNWSASSIVLQSGQNVITVTASDAAGNKGTSTITVTYTPPDKTAPTVSITNPTSSGTHSTATSPLNISGSASDNVGVKQVTWSNDKGGSGTCTGTDNWSASGITLQSGDNVITVTASDATGNKGTSTITVTYTPPDKTPPAVSITNPTSSGTHSTGTSPLNIGGTASDNVGVKQVTWSNDRGGSGTCTGTDNWSASGITLQSGQNVITVTASDAAGNKGTSTITVTYTPPDTVSPTVSITNPTSSGTHSTATSPLNISGTASDNVGVKQVTWSNDRGGSGTCTGTDNWSASGIALQNGDNVITVTARDAAGNTASSDITVTYTPAGTCPPGQVHVPDVITKTEAAAKEDLKQKKFAGVVVQRDYSDTVADGIVMNQSPSGGDCAALNSIVDLWVSRGPKPATPSNEPPKNFTAELDCGSSFELAPGDVLGRSCGIIVKGWISNTDRRVEVKVAYNKNSGIDIFPGDTSAPASLMYTAGVNDYYDRYIFSEGFTAKDSAPPGTTTVTITVSQEGAGAVTLTVDVAVLKKGLPTSSGSGIRPPATVATGSGGEFCVWRYKLFGDPPPCFHLVMAVCTEPRYNNPRNGYELVGANMTWEEGDTHIAYLSKYFDDAYGCLGLGAGVKDTDGDGVPDDKDGCPKDPNKKEQGICGCGISDRDSDYDGTPDCIDKCPDDINKIAPGVCDCGTPDKNTDGDKEMDCNDECPTDPDKVKRGVCDCFSPDVDSDGDLTLDCEDRCPNDRNKIKDAGYCDCGNPETDTDKDLWPDCIDLCPNDPYKTDDPGLCDCGTPETDTDKDLWPDCIDNCPNDPYKIDPGICDCGVADVDSDNDGVPDCKEKPENTKCPKYDPTDPACEPTSKGPKPPADPNIGSGFQGGMPGNNPGDNGAAGGGTTTQPQGYAGTGKPGTGGTGDSTPPGNPPYIGSDGQPTCQYGWAFGPNGLCIPAPACPLDWVRGYDGICKPKGSLIPPPKPGDGGTQPTSPGGCPKGCHVKKDGTGGCDCDEGGGGGTTPPSTTPPTKPTPKPPASPGGCPKGCHVKKDGTGGCDCDEGGGGGTTPPPKPPKTSTPTGGGGG